jgi:hypothetical protein
VRAKEGWLMRRTTTTSFPTGLAARCATGVLLATLVATSGAAEQHGGGAAGSGDAGPKMAKMAMMAKIHPVAVQAGRVDEMMTYGTAKFSQGKDKVDVLVQVAGVPLGGREAGPASDGAGATVPFEVHVLKTGDCTKTTDAKVLVELPNLQVKDDGSGILMASTDDVKLDDLAGQVVVIGAPGNKIRAGCGVISAQ